MAKANSDKEIEFIADIIKPYDLAALQEAAAGSGDARADENQPLFYFVFQNHLYEIG